MGTYRCSDGTRVSQAQIDRRVKKAKAQKLQQLLDEQNFFSCEECKHNGSGTKLDLSHDVSLKDAKERGETELCWDVENLTLLCRSCHQKKDRLNLQFG